MKKKIINWVKCFFGNHKWEEFYWPHDFDSNRVCKKCYRSEHMYMGDWVPYIHHPYK